MIQSSQHSNQPENEMKSPIQHSKTTIAMTTAISEVGEIEYQITHSRSDTGETWVHMVFNTELECDAAMEKIAAEVTALSKWHQIARY